MRTREKECGGCIAEEEILSAEEETPSMEETSPKVTEKNCPKKRLLLLSQNNQRIALPVQPLWQDILP